MTHRSPPSSRCEQPGSGGSAGVVWGRHQGGLLLYALYTLHSRPGASGQAFAGWAPPREFLGVTGIVRGISTYDI